MVKKNFFKVLKLELERIDGLNIQKRFEIEIEAYSTDSNPRALINGKKYSVFNSNDYLVYR